MAALFVHGNLRPGQPDFWRLERYTTGIETITITGYALHDADDPILIRTGHDTDTVTGEVIHLEDATSDALLNALDRLHITYGQARHLITIQTHNGPHDAWVYIATDAAGSRLVNGDWNTVEDNS